MRKLLNSTVHNATLRSFVSLEMAEKMAKFQTVDDSSDQRGTTNISFRIRRQQYDNVWRRRVVVIQVDANIPALSYWGAVSLIMQVSSDVSVCDKGPEDNKQTHSSLKIPYSLNLEFLNN